MALRILLRGISGGVEGWNWESPSTSTLRVGRVDTLELVLSDSSASRRHAEFRLTENGWMLADLGSTNGTYRNGTRLGKEEVPIISSDIVRFGNVVFVVNIPPVLENRIGIVPVESFPIPDGVAESLSAIPSVPSFGDSDNPTFCDVAPPKPGGHPPLWRLRLSGNRPLATPAIANGRLFVGGGFGSHEFYAFAADTGQQLWRYDTKDDGPTAAIVEDGLVAFNTESCELEVVTVDGIPVWKKWLGDPLTSMPAAANGRVFIVFPDSKGDRCHYLACFQMRTGEEVWRQPVNGAAITAPVLAEGNVIVTTLDGALCCFHQDSGSHLWNADRNATSSPSIWRGRCYFSRRRWDSIQNECMSSSPSMMYGEFHDFEKTWQRADYLDYSKRQSLSDAEAMSQTLDGSVGFQTSKGDVDTNQSQVNLGQGTVAGLWSFQGSRPFFHRDDLYCCMGDSVLCLNPSTSRTVWKTKVIQGNNQLFDHVLTPPILVNGKVFVGTSFGEIACLCAHSGEWLWREIIGEPITFQPAVAQGRMYIPTSNGSLYCLETGDEKDDGWLMWGGTAAHNGADLAREEIIC